MNLEDSGLGEDYVDSTTWQMLPGVPERNIAAPTATGACDTAVLYKSTPPAVSTPSASRSRPTPALTGTRGRRLRLSGYKLC